MLPAEIELNDIARQAKMASKKIASASLTARNETIRLIAENLRIECPAILQANANDYRAAEQDGMGHAMLDRLLLTEDRLKSISEDASSISRLPDPLGEFMEMRTLPNGLLMGKKRVPLGVIAAIYESRPNVTVDIACLCLKAGNAIILRGGKETLDSNRSLVSVIQHSLIKAGLPGEAVQLIESPDHELVLQLLKMRNNIDLVIPRGGAPLINFVRDNSLIPVVAGGIGVCHTYVDKAANIPMAVDIVVNAKVQRPTVCNALDTIIVHREIAPSYLPEVALKLAAAGVELRCDEEAFSIIGDLESVNAIRATPDDFGYEFLELIASIKIVKTLEDALTHVSVYGSGHSEAIVTEDYPAALRFLNDVDAACVYVNASTRFTDGAQFGLGAELGISTQKIHARGPMGLKEITSYKWVIFGTGQIRP